jgi:SSS family solute:Na+ symporter
MHVITPHLGFTDLFIITLYLAGTLYIGWVVGLKKESGEDYFLAGRKLRWPLIGFSLFASNMSGSSFIGLAGEGYARGVAVFNYEWVAVVILVFFSFFILPIYLQSKIYTIPEYLEKRFDRKSRVLFSGFTVLANIFIDAAAGLYAGGIVVQMVYPETPIWIPITLIGILAGVYTIFGGLSAVVITDTIQAIVLLTGASIISIMCFLKLDSLSTLVSRAPDNAFSLILPYDDPFLPWPGLLTGVFIIGFYFWATNQFIVQRTLGAKDIHHARWGALFAGFLKLPVLFLMILPGTIGLVLYPNLDSPDLIFPTLVFDLLPIGARGIVVAAMIAAIMSSIDSTLNSAATLVTMDFILPLRKNLSQKAIVKIGQWVTLVFMFLSILWAPQIIRFETLWHYLQSILAYITPPIVVCFITGIFWKRANAQASFYTLLIGIPFGISAFIFNEMLGLAQIHFLYACFCLFVFCLLLITSISLMTPSPDYSKITRLTWNKNDFQIESIQLKKISWYQNYRILSGLLLLLTSVLIIFFL